MSKSPYWRMGRNEPLNPGVLVCCPCIAEEKIEPCVNCITDTTPAQLACTFTLQIAGGVNPICSNCEAIWNNQTFILDGAQCLYQGFFQATCNNVGGFDPDIEIEIRMQITPNINTDIVEIQGETIMTYQPGDLITNTTWVEQIGTLPSEPVDCNFVNQNVSIQASTINDCFHPPWQGFGNYSLLLNAV